MRNKKVLLIHNLFWSSYKAVVFSELYNICLKNQIDFTVIHISLNEGRRRNTGKVNKDLHNYPYTVLKYDFYENITQISIIRKILKLLKEENYDLIILPGYDQLSYIFLSIFLRFIKIPFINVCDSTFHDKKRKNLLLRFIKGRILNLANIIFCYGSAAKSYLMYLGISVEKIHIRYQACDVNFWLTELDKHRSLEKTEIIGNKLSDSYLLYIGRLASEKNLTRLFKAFASTSSKFNNLQLVLIGDGPSSEELYKLRNKLNLDKKILFLGGMTTQEMVPYYLYAKSVILPSISEPWGVVINEAMVCSKPVLVSNYCGCATELVEDGVNGFTFNPFSIDDIGRAIENLMKTIDLENMGNESFKKIKSYTPYASANMMFQGMKKLLK